MHHVRLLAAVLAVCLLGSVRLPGQARPDAGALQPQVPAQETLPLPGPGQALLGPPAQELPAAGPSVHVQAIRFEGNTLVASATLEASVKDFLDRQLDFGELQRAAAAAGEAYRRAGWTARVYLPQQDITSGVVTFQVIESRFGDIQVKGAASSRFQVDEARRYLLSAQAPGEPLRAGALDRALLLVNDLPGINASGNLTAGKVFASTDLLLDLQDERLMRGIVSIDNLGARATGAGRITATGYLESPSGIGDELQANLLYSEGGRYGGLGYNRPLGHRGLRLNLDASRFDYSVVTDEFAALDLEGDSFNWGANATYPLIRERTRNLYVGAGYTGRQLRNKSLGLSTSDYRVNNFNLSLTGNLYDKLGGGGSTFASLIVTAGDLDLGTLNPGENAANAGGFIKVNYSLARQQAIVPNLTFFTRVTGQLADKNLDTSEQSYLGGGSGVRAFPVNEAGGSESLMANLELRYRLHPLVVAKAFYDWGSVRQNVNNSVRPARPNSYQIDGAGVAATWTPLAQLLIEATYARRIGDNPNRTTAGRDQDGTLIKDRFWVRMQLTF